jgi:hypothetical protein
MMILQLKPKQNTSARNASLFIEMGARTSAPRTRVKYAAEVKNLPSCCPPQIQRRSFERITLLAETRWLLKTRCCRAREHTCCDCAMVRKRPLTRSREPFCLSESLKVSILVLIPFRHLAASEFELI